MSDYRDIPPEEIPSDRTPLEEIAALGEDRDTKAASEPSSASVPEQASSIVPEVIPERAGQASAIPVEIDSPSRRRFRHTLFQLLFFSLAAFIMTVWIFVRVAPPLGSSLIGPQEVARAQLRALDRGELRPAYDMLSARYRQQVSFDLWRQLILSHWRMFHAEVVRSGELAQSGPRVTLEIYLRGADEKAYRARFTLIRLDGQWWVDDLHWAEEANTRDMIGI